MFPRVSSVNAAAVSLAPVGPPAADTAFKRNFCLSALVMSCLPRNAPDFLRAGGGMQSSNRGGNFLPSRSLPHLTLAAYK